MNKTTAILILLLAWPVLSAGAQQKRTVTLSDIDAVSRPAGLSVAPDGRLVAYAVNGRLYVAGPAVDAPRALTPDGTTAWQPRWSASGDHLYFSSSRSGSAQLWKLPVAEFGEAMQVTAFEHGMPGAVLSPDENRVLTSFSVRDLSDAADEDAPPPPFVVTRRQFKQDAGEGYLTEADTQFIHIYDIESGGLRRLTTGAFDESQPAWSPDGKQVAFVTNRAADADATYDTDIWIADADGGGDPRPLADDAHQDYAPAFSPDGRLVAFVTAGDAVYSVPHIAVVPADGGEPRILTRDLDRWVGRFEFSGDGRHIYFTYANAGSTELARVRIADARIERIVEGNVRVSGFDAGPRDIAAVTLNQELDAPELYLLNGSRRQRLTHINDAFLDEVRLGEKRKVSFASRDGTRVEAFITLPPGAGDGRAWPAILNIHGGPVGQYEWGYDFSTQFLAASGYLVIEPNPRGSSGFGEDYIRAIYRTWGITDYDDVIAAVDYAVDAGLADPDRLAVTGYSYGGYMTNVVITGTNRFKAAASGAGHSLIEANFGHDIYQQWYTWELGFPWEQRERYDVLSPFLRAGNIETPTLFLGGRLDWNVPVLNAELMYQALQARGIDTQLVVYPGVHHGGWPTEYERDYLERVVAWFDRYLAD